MVGTESLQMGFLVFNSVLGSSAGSEGLPSLQGQGLE
jgi:hypothetical protein